MSKLEMNFINVRISLTELELAIKDAIEKRKHSESFQKMILLDVLNEAVEEYKTKISSLKEQDDYNSRKLESISKLSFDRIENLIRHFENSIPGIVFRRESSLNPYKEQSTKSHKEIYRIIQEDKRNNLKISIDDKLTDLYSYKAREYMRKEFNVSSYEASESSVSKHMSYDYDNFHYAILLEISKDRN